jgi:NAD dependent epimerase/dehydratase
VNWSGRKVLVTGAGGFIGSHLTERLVHLGARTRALVRYNSSGSFGWLDGSPCKKDVEVIAGDIRDLDIVQRAVQQVEYVFHLAALIGIPYSYHAPISYVRTNVEGTVNVLQAALNADVNLVVHTSTSEVYGTARYVPIDENHTLQGQSPYSASKIGADKLAESFYLSFNLPVSIIRPFNTYGPRQSARAIIPTITVQALTQPAVSLGNLEPLRDLTYVEDTVEGFIEIAQHTEAIGQVINIGSGQEISIGDLAKTILKLMGKDIPVIRDKQRIRPRGSEVERLCADTRKAQQLLGWSPSNSLKQGLMKTIEWIQLNYERYQADTYII